MGLDRRLVAILFYNGINDVTRVEKYLGRKDDYLEVIIDGKLEKLKIPGILYPDNIISTEFEIEKTDKNVLEKMETFTNNLEEVVESIKKSENDLFTTKIVTETKELSFEEELEKTEKENQEVLKSIKKEKPKIEKKTEKRKTKIVELKELDNDIDNFIDSI